MILKKDEFIGGDVIKICYLEEGRYLSEWRKPPML